MITGEHFYQMFFKLKDLESYLFIHSNDLGVLTIHNAFTAAYVGARWAICPGPPKNI